MATPSHDLCLGAQLLPDKRCRFTVWAPEKTTMVLVLLSPKREIKMEKQKEGYFTCIVDDVTAGTRYWLCPDGNKGYPDPASCFQPEGVHGPSEVVDHASFSWTDALWRGIPFSDLILYELHVGTFTPQGTFEAIIPRLDDLANIGINAIEIMPVSQFPGSRNWGYDGVFPYAVQNSYGGPDGLKKLVDACHAKGIAVFQDVVYNHLGPEGNYFEHFGPYFTNRYGTPWGKAINYDGEWSDGVRCYFAWNALYWFNQFHLDGLRLDAVHMVFDNGAIPFWAYLNEKAQRLQLQLGRPLHMVAESDLNSPRVVQPVESGGMGFGAQWLDDFHHALYTILDKKGRDRYIDFGLMEQLAKAYSHGFVHSGEFVKFRKRRHGAPSAGIPGDRFVIFNLNHDQVGNRPEGERLCALVDYQRLKIAAAATMLAPYVPMLFMGEEYAEMNPFYYFVSHSDKELIEAVRKGRKEEFKDFATEGEMPDPQGEDTFKQCILDWKRRGNGMHLRILQWHQELIQLRRQLAPLRNFNKSDVQVIPIGQAGLVLIRHTEDGTSLALCLFNFSERTISWIMPAYFPSWRKVADSREARWEEEPHSIPLISDLVAANDTVTLPPLSVTVLINESLSSG
jgi:maltooligosyltrehalose trehalohydrolase